MSNDTLLEKIEMWVAFILALVITISFTFWFAGWITSPSNVMDEFCIDNGFKEATDYKVKNNTNTLIECDKKDFFNTIRIKECTEFNKWGDCEWMKTKEYISSQLNEEGKK